jgi:hypothetical protein
VKLTAMTLAAAGYVLGARAGHERYEQIVVAMEAVSRRLQEFSDNRPPAQVTTGPDAGRLPSARIREPR